MNFIGDNFLYNELSYIESTGILGKDSGFSAFLSNFKIDASGDTFGDTFDREHTAVNWRKTQPHYHFFHDYVDGEAEVSNLLLHSSLKELTYGYTWLNWSDPIIKIKTADLIQKWDTFHRASVEGFVFVVENGLYVCEFARYYLHSNFEIKKGTLFV